MTHFTHQTISDHLRHEYFENDYMNFGIESGYYVLGLNGKKYEIIYETFEKYQDTLEYVETALKTKYPEIFL